MNDAYLRFPRDLRGHAPTSTQEATHLDVLIDGRYRLGERLGHGGMGIVFKAHDIALDRPVAIKVVGASRTPFALARFQKEARAIARVRHDNVIQIYAFGSHLGSHYIAMEYVDGADLAALFDADADRVATMPLDSAMAIIGSIGRGLEAVHACGLVHRDVKPGNIVVESGTGRPVLIDFGLARARDRRSTGLSVACGTPWYMAPEQAKDVTGAATTARSDLYALACTAYEAFSGQPAYEGEDVFEVLKAHGAAPTPRISRVKRWLAPLDDVLCRGMAKSPDDRYPTCAAFVAALEEAVAAVAVDDVEPTTMRRPAASSPLLKAPTRALLLLREEELRRPLERVLAQTLGVRSSEVDIEHVRSGPELLVAFGRKAADVVLVDDESAGGAGARIAEGLRGAPGGRDAEILVLVRGLTSHPREFVELGCRALPKPINLRLLGSALDRAADLIAERRRDRPTVGAESVAEA